MRYFWLLVLLRILIFSFEPDSLSKNKTSIGLLNLELRDVDTNEAESLNNRLLKALEKHNVYKVKALSNVDNIDHEKFENCNVLSCWLEVGDELLVDKVISGTVTKTEHNIILKLQLIDMESRSLKRTFSSFLNHDFKEVLKCIDEAVVYLIDPVSDSGFKLSHLDVEPRKEDSKSKNIEPERNHEIFIDAGLGSALGLYGVGYAYNIKYKKNRWIKTEFGIGKGFSGTQLSFMIKSVIGSLNHRSSIGVGLSKVVNQYEFEYKTKNINWLNIDLLGYEYHKKNFFFHFAMGFSSSLKKIVKRKFLGCLGEYYYDDEDYIECNPYNDPRYMYFLQGRIGIGIVF